MMFKKITTIKFVIFLAIFLSGCGLKAIKQTNLLLSQEDGKTKQIALSLGQRTFDVASGELTKAVINAFSNKNLTVLNVTKDSGFMMAEGPNFLSNAQLLNVIAQRNARYNGVFPFGEGSEGPFLGGNCIPDANLRVTANIYNKAEKRTLIKLNINHMRADAPCKCNMGGVINHPYSPPEVMRGYKWAGYAYNNLCPFFPLEMVSSWYRELWDEIEKSIFMQRETILN